MTSQFKFAFLIPTLIVQIAMLSAANAGCREAYLAAINQAEPSAQSIGDIAIANASLVPVAISGISTSATSFTDHMRRENLKETLQLIDESLAGEGLALSELAGQTGHELEQVAGVIRELDSTARICADRLLSGDETRLLVIGIVNSN